MAGTHTSAALEGVALSVSGSAYPAGATKTLDAHIPSIRDSQYGGKGRVSGTVKVDGSPDVPVKRKVRLIRDVDGICIRETWSDPATGAYSFDNIDETVRYTVLSYDYQHTFRAVVADNVTPTFMP